MATWDGAFENSPPGSELISLGDNKIRELKSEVRDRGEVELNWGSVTGGQTDDGRLNPGAARAFADTVEPTHLRLFSGANQALLPGGGSAALGLNDKGRMWLDENSDPATLKYWDGTAWVALAVGGGTSGGPGPGAGQMPFKNALFNGSFEVWQRGASFVVNPVTPSRTYRADRWFTQSSVGADSNQRRTLPGVHTLPTGCASRYGILLTGGVATTGTVDLVQRIEGSVIRVVNGTITVSFLMRYTVAAVATAITPTLILTTPDAIEDDFSSLNAAAYSIAHPGGAVSDGVLTWAGIDISAFGDIDKGLEVRLRFPALSLNATDKLIVVTDAQVERNSARTAFEYRPLATELELCQRYYEKTFPYDAAPSNAQNPGGALITRTAANSGNAFQDVATSWRFNTPKRSIDYTVAFYSPVVGTGHWYKLAGPGGGGGLAGAGNSLLVPTESIGLDTRSNTGVGVGTSSAGTGADENAVIAIHATADAEL